MSITGLEAWRDTERELTIIRREDRMMTDTITYEGADSVAQRLEAVRTFAKGQAHGGHTYREQAAYGRVQRMARELLGDLDDRQHSPRDVAMVLAVAQNHPALWHAYATGGTPDIEPEDYLTEYGF